jgi:hypothetical protein
MSNETLLIAISKKSKYLIVNISWAVACRLYSVALLIRGKTISHFIYIL